MYHVLVGGREADKDMIMLFNKIVRIPVGTDLSRPCSSVEMPEGRDRSVPTGDVSSLICQTASSVPTPMFFYQIAYLGPNVRTRHLRNTQRSYQV